jgi:GTP pyrophosphokinase
MATKDFIFIEGWAKGKGYNQLLKALYVSQKLHEGQYRKDGQPYIVHPTAVTATAIRHGIEDEITLCIMQLHDVIEDCNVSVGSLIEDYGFSKEVAKGVLTLTKTEGRPFKFYIQEIASDIRCTLAKIGDRGHNISTMCGGFSIEKQKSYVAETQEIIELCREARRLYPEYSNYIVEMKKNIHNICDITMFFIKMLEENEKTS